MKAAALTHLLHRPVQGMKDLTLQDGSSKPSQAQPHADLVRTLQLFLVCCCFGSAGETFVLMAAVLQSFCSAARLVFLLSFHCCRFCEWVLLTGWGSATLIKCFIVLPWAQVFEGKIIEGDGKSGHVISATAGTGANKITYNYSTERVVGNGSFGVVFQATWLEGGETVSQCLVNAQMLSASWVAHVLIMAHLAMLESCLKYHSPFPKALWVGLGTYVQFILCLQVAIKKVLQDKRFKVGYVLDRPKVAMRCLNYRSCVALL